MSWTVNIFILPYRVCDIHSRAQWGVVQPRRLFLACWVRLRPSLNSEFILILSQVENLTRRCCCGCKLTNNVRYDTYFLWLIVNKNCESKLTNGAILGVVATSQKHDQTSRNVWYLEMTSNHFRHPPTSTPPSNKKVVTITILSQVSSFSIVMAIQIIKVLWLNVILNI